MLHFEGKIWHTLPLLAWRPGAADPRYIDGERARFVSPMALFLFSVFLMFAVFQLVGIGAPDGPRPRPSIEAATRTTPRGSAGRPAQRARRLRRGQSAPRPRSTRRSRELEQRDCRSGARLRRGARTSDEAVLLGERRRPKQAHRAPDRLAFLDHGIDKWRENPELMAYKLQANSYKFSWLLIPLSVPFVWLLFAWRRRSGPTTTRSS